MTQQIHDTQHMRDGTGPVDQWQTRRHLTQQTNDAQHIWEIDGAGTGARRNVHDMSLYEGMAVGDIVSYKGDCYTLESADPADQWPPARVFLS